MSAPQTTFALNPDTAIRAGPCRGLIPAFLRERAESIVRTHNNDPDLVRRLRTIVPRRLLARPEVAAVLDWARLAMLESKSTL